MAKAIASRSLCFTVNSEASWPAQPVLVHLSNDDASQKLLFSYKRLATAHQSIPITTLFFWKPKPTMAIKCHYEVLGVEQTADSSAIKKAHRKLALKLHPDKNVGNESVADEFRLVQEAYECLSDPTERAWYDNHREAILRGSTSSNGEEDALFNVVPFCHASCYQKYSNKDGDFFAVYRMVFGSIVSDELQKNSEADILYPTDFGDPDSNWEHVGAFYQSWEAFQSGLDFLWVDEYDPFAIKEAPSRWVRRKMEEENKKMRKAAKKKRNEEIAALVKFVKRRDPRVKARILEMQQQKANQETQRKLENERKKQENKELREQWRVKVHEDMAAAEEVDRRAGRVRLADLEDDYDYGGKKGKNKKGKNKKPQIESSESEDSENDVEEGTNNDQAELKLDESSQGEADHDKDEAIYSSEEETSESEEEPDFWRCEVCRKDFKSQGQMENHLKSKKHKEMVKKQARAKT